MSALSYGIVSYKERNLVLRTTLIGGGPPAKHQVSKGNVHSPYATESETRQRRYFRVFASTTIY